MDESTDRPAHRLILLTAGALADLANIDNATAAMWGDAQADRYLGFLGEMFSILAHNPKIAAIVEQRPGYLVFTAKYSKRRSAHGHRIFFREIDGGIEIIRLLHTAMYWPDHITGHEDGPR